MGKNKNRRPQKQKSSPERIARVQGLRQSSAAEPHRPKTAYTRKPKHREW